MSFSTNDDLRITGAEFGVNNRQRTPCILVLDASGSMSGKKIRQLNAGLKDLEKNLKSDEDAREQVQLAVIRIDSTAAVITDWCDAAQFTAPYLEASGSTALGEGVALGLKMIGERKSVYNANGISYTRPWMFIITDGQPNDIGWEEKAAQARQAEDDNKVVIWPVGVEGANLQVLGRFKSNGRIFKLAETDFRKLFVWLSSSLGKVSSSQPGAVVRVEAPPMISVPT